MSEQNPTIYDPFILLFEIGVACALLLLWFLLGNVQSALFRAALQQSAFPNSMILPVVMLMPWILSTIIMSIPFVITDGAIVTESVLWHTLTTSDGDPE